MAGFVLGKIYPIGLCGSFAAPFKLYLNNTNKVTYDEFMFWPGSCYIQSAYFRRVRSAGDLKKGSRLMIDSKKKREKSLVPGSLVCNRGYTLIEIMIALLIGSVLTAMAIPQVRSGVYRYRLQGAVASSTWAIQSTRYQSLRDGIQYQVVFTKVPRTVAPPSQMWLVPEPCLFQACPRS
jgi:prepilin-type N-terminal cleavage/methylation domain-containing protein